MNKWPFCIIGKKYSFSASHQLSGLQEGHKCARLHGHNYTIELEVRGEIHPTTGMVVDFAHIDRVIKPLIERLDHHHLNDVIEGSPTAENIALWIMHNVDQHIFYAVTVWETEKCWARVENRDGLYHKELR